MSERPDRIARGVRKPVCPWIEITLMVHISKHVRYVRTMGWVGEEHPFNL